MRSFNVFFVVSLLFAVNAELLPKITRLSQEQTRDVGETVEFECSMPKLVDYPHMWKKNKDRIISSRGALLIRDPRFSIRSNETSVIVRITDIQEADAGNYECEVVINSNDKISGVVPFHVRKRPSIADNSTFSIVIKEHDDIQLECYAEGFPVPTISWQRNNNARFPNGEQIYRGNVLLIPKASKEYRGLYYCIAENSVGRSSRREIPVGILYAPIIEVPRPRVGQALLYDANLVCRVDSFPRSIVVWKKNDEVLSTGENYTILNFDSSEKYMDSILRIKSIKSNQYGEYTCIMQNALGIAEKKIELFETINPTCPPACNPIQINGTNAASNVTRVENNKMAHNITAVSDLP